MTSVLPTEAARTAETEVGGFGWKSIFIHLLRAGTRKGKEITHQ
jgi:hypothetical protein